MEIFQFAQNKYIVNMSKHINKYITTQHKNIKFFFAIR